VKRLLHRTGRLGKADELYGSALGIDERVSGTEHPVLVLLLTRIGDLRRDQGRYADAESLYRRAIRIGQRKLFPGSPDMETALKSYAALMALRGRRDSASAGAPRR
jgi:tetratricopeptide (TPR) repeat protein